MVFNGVPGYNRIKRQLETNSAKTGLKTGKKTKILRTNTTCNIPIVLEDGPIAELESFKYLGSIIYTQGRADKDALTRIGKANSNHIPHAQKHLEV